MENNFAETDNFLSAFSFLWVAAAARELSMHAFYSHKLNGNSSTEKLSNLSRSENAFLIN